MATDIAKQYTKPQPRVLRLSVAAEWVLKQVISGMVQHERGLFAQDEDFARESREDNPGVSDETMFYVTAFDIACDLAHEGTLYEDFMTDGERAHLSPMHHCAARAWLEHGREHWHARFDREQREHRESFGAAFRAQVHCAETVNRVLEMVDNARENK